MNSGPSNANQTGRQDLAAWMDNQPTSFYEANPCLQALQKSSWSESARAKYEPIQREFGVAAAGPVERAVIENNHHTNLPNLDGWDGIGRRAGRVHYHPSYHEAGRHIYGSGIMSAYGETSVSHRHILSLFYLSAQVGEGGHNCPLACTAGAIRAIQAIGSPEQKAQFLPRLLDPNWDTNMTGAQFLTEIQGGSDVGQNATQAVQQGDGTWRIYGEKWFCSNVSAEVALMTARPEGASKGTRGLGLFLVPNLAPDGSPNRYRARRLKDKLGTRSMASAELDFDGAYAEALGPVGDGFKNMINLVINTSRLYNAFGCSGHAYRAWLIASGYAQHRQAFGRPILHYPLVQETLVLTRVEAEACLAGSWLLAGMQEELDADRLSVEEQAFFRMALNLNKVRTAILGHQAVCRGIEILGGNGAIESFSVLPRLLRDNVVYENWEGTHNTLLMQVLRDCQRLQLHKGFFATLRTHLDTQLIDPEEKRLEEILQAEPMLATVQMRPMMDRLATLVQLAGLKPLIGEGFVARAQLLHDLYLGNGLSRDSGYLKRLERCLAD